MATLTQFYPYVLTHLMGCPDSLLEQAVQSTCIDFCRRTLLVQTVSTYSIVATTQDYAITIPANSTLVKVLGVWVEDSWLTPTTVEGVRTATGLRGTAGSATADTGTPITYFQKTPTASSISLYPVPSVAITTGLTVRAAFAPLHTATTVDDVLYEDWVEAIASGAIYRVSNIADQTFSNPQTAANAAAVYERAVRRATTVARTGLIAGASRVQPVRFA